MTILVTGSDGFLGSAVVRALAALDARVVPVVKDPPAGFTGAVCDLGDGDAVCRLLSDTRPSAVVNIAAVADFSAGVLPRLFPVNTLCPAILAGYCAATGAHLVQASMAVHGRQASRFGPSVPVAPATDYGRSKWLAEEAIFASGCRSAVIRFGGIFGPSGPAHLGLNRSIDAARAGKRPTVVGSGSARRNYLYVEDAARMVAACVSTPLTGVFYAGGETMSVREMLQAICDVWLPGLDPITQPGDEGEDQLVEPAPELGAYRSFRSALEDMR